MAESQSRPSILDEEPYDALREKGLSKEKAARIANADPESTDQDSRPYEERSVDELHQKAREVGIEGRSDMNKDELIDALRNH